MSTASSTSAQPQGHEATECVVDALRAPLRSTRKVVYYNKSFRTAATSATALCWRKRYEGKDATIAPTSQSVLYSTKSAVADPASRPCRRPSPRFNLFSMLSESVGTVIVSAGGYEDVTIGGRKFNARIYKFDVGMTPYKYWMVMQSGHGVPARVDMGSTRFENLKLEPKKVTKFPKYSAAAQSAPQNQQRTFGNQRDDQQSSDDANNENDDAISPYLPPPPQQNP